jgi:hypothetical protein
MPKRETDDRQAFDETINSQSSLLSSMSTILSLLHALWGLVEMD